MRSFIEEKYKSKHRKAKATYWSILFACLSVYAIILLIVINSDVSLDTRFIILGVGATITIWYGFFGWFGLCDYITRIIDEDMLRDYPVLYKLDRLDRTIWSYNVEEELPTRFRTVFRNINQKVELVENKMKPYETLLSKLMDTRDQYRGDAPQGVEDAISKITNALENISDEIKKEISNSIKEDIDSLEKHR